jgi:large subunit ribosomal protein L4
MMQVNLLDNKKAIEVSEEIFGQKYNEPLIHQVVTAYLAAGRAGTAAQKTRAEVRGGGKKPWKQKGTGRARVGSSRSPLWKGGGVIFAAKTRCYEQKVNKKMYRGAICSMLSELIRLERLQVVEQFALKEAKTKLLIAELKKFDLNKVLIVTEQADANLYLAARNVPYVDVCTVAEINPVCLISYEKVLVTAEALKKIEDWLA